MGLKKTKSRGAQLSDVATKNEGRIWKHPTTDTARVERLVQAFGMPTPVAQLLDARGFSEPENLESFLQPRLERVRDPERLPNMKSAVQRIWQALTNHERITVFGDYDVDGLTSTALMTRVLRELGGQVEPFLPKRLDEGYGLSLDALDRCTQDTRPQLIITVDCGTSSAEAVKKAATLGIDVVVTDHHEPGAQVAPAIAVVNPKLSTDSSSRILAGVGVAFKVCHAVIKEGRLQKHPAAEKCDLRRFLDYVALGTITDIMPLLEENRVFVRHGLKRLAHTEWIGLRALKEVAGVGDAEVDTYHVGFLLGPRLNAAGRLNEAELSLELLLTDDTVRARELADQLDVANRERQQIEKQTVEEAMHQIDAFFSPTNTYALVAYGAGWHPGVVGIVASRVCKKYYRPTLIIGVDEEGVGKGSGRSISEFNLVEHLNLCSEFLTKHGGHAMAAGLEIGEPALADFRHHFNRVARQTLEGIDLRPTQRIDSWLDGADINDELMHWVDKLKPFGESNPRPVWGMRDVAFIGQPTTVGQNHLKGRIGGSGWQFDAIGFGMAGRVRPAGRFNLACQVRPNTFRGVTRLQFQMEDFQPI